MIQKLAILLSRWRLNLNIFILILEVFRVTAPNTKAQIDRSPMAIFWPFEFEESLVFIDQLNFTNCRYSRNLVYCGRTRRTEYGYLGYSDMRNGKSHTRVLWNWQFYWILSNNEDFIGPIGTCLGWNVRWVLTRIISSKMHIYQWKP